MLFTEKLDLLLDTLLSLPDKSSTQLRRAFADHRSNGAVAVGSGGSLATARYFRRCRLSLGCNETSVQTPLEFSNTNSSLANSAVWLFSAGGENPDILAAYQAAVDRGATKIVVVTNRSESQLCFAASRNPKCKTIIVPVSVAKDGFIATHTMVAVIYALLVATSNQSDTEELANRFIEQARRILRVRRQDFASHHSNWSLEDRPHLLLLFDPKLDAAATVIETSLWETAICSVQATDFRNFAHGRHVWLAHRGAETGLVALTSSSDQKAWLDLRELLPAGIPVLELEYSGNGRYWGAVAVVQALALVEYLGEIGGIDPAKPGTAPYSKPIYEARSLPVNTQVLFPAVRQKMSAIEALDLESVSPQKVEQHYRRWLDRMFLANFSGIVCDYDGTMVSTEERLQPPKSGVVKELVRLLGYGIHISIATGRGSSVAKELRRVVPETYHSQVTVAYYNGSAVLTLSQDLNHSAISKNNHIEDAYAWLKQCGLLLPDRLQDVKNSRGLQISGPVGSLYDLETFKSSFEIKCIKENWELTVATSGHSFDIWDRNHSKLSHVYKTRTNGKMTLFDILCIGDSGERGGNDYELLGSKHGVSVGRVSDDLDTCWSFFGRAIEGSEAFMRILGSLEEADTGRVRFNVTNLGHDKP